MHNGVKSVERGEQGVESVEWRAGSGERRMESREQRIDLS